MTQKELLYFEDAIGHEDVIIKVCEETMNKLEDESLKSFINDEIDTHTSMKEKLLNLLEEKANE